MRTPTGPVSVAASVPAAGTLSVHVKEPAATLPTTVHATLPMLTEAMGRAVKLVPLTVSFLPAVHTTTAGMAPTTCGCTVQLTRACLAQQPFKNWLVRTNADRARLSAEKNSGSRTLV